MKDIVLITGCGGLIGSEASEFFISQGYRVVGIDNNMRSYFFGQESSIESSVTRLKELSSKFTLHNIDIRNHSEVEKIFSTYSTDIKCIIHTAAQPSHDWAAREVFTDFEINTTATINLLELTRRYCSEACFIYTSTNKVYGDNPNFLSLHEHETRYELLGVGDRYWNGITEIFSTDGATHSLFGCSKLAADVYVQEYGKYYGLNTVVFRGGCLTGSKHKGAELHGFLNYLVKCNLEDKKYRINGYKGKQVRDNIHSADLISAFYEVFKNPRKGEVYNIGGSRHSNCSILEAISLIEEYTNKKTDLEYTDQNRIGDHIWWISDVSKFRKHYPQWDYTYTLPEIIYEIVDNHG